MNRQQVAVISGVSSGIGLGLSKQFLSNNWKVFGTVRKLQDAEELSSNYAEFQSVEMDVTNSESVEKAVDCIIGLSPEGIDLLINNAGIAIGGPLMHVPLDEFRYQFEVNVFGLLQFTQGLYPALKQQASKPPGRVIQMSSVSGKIGFPFLGPYVSSKFALEGLSESLRRELLQDKIRVITIGPGAVKTPIWEKSVGPVAAIYESTSYAKAINRLNDRFVSNSIKTALTVESLCKKVYEIAIHSKPRIRYTFMAKKLTNYILPRLLPSRWLDRIIGKQLFG